MGDADGEKPRPAVDLSLLEYPLHDAGNFLEHRRRSHFLQKIQIRSHLGNIARSPAHGQLADQIPDGRVQRRVFDLLRPHAVVFHQQHFGVDEGAVRKPGFDFLDVQRLRVCAVPGVFGGSLFRGSRSPEKALGEEKLQSLVLDQPFSDFVNLGLDSRRVIPVQPGEGVPVAHPDDVNLVGAARVVLEYDFSVFLGEHRGVHVGDGRREAQGGKEDHQRENRSHAGLSGFQGRTGRDLHDCFI